MTVAELRQALQETPTVLIPIGVTEQHGYHLTLDTDSQTAWQLSVRASAETGALVAPLLPYGYSGGELPGTININYHIVGLLIKEILRALAAHGLRNLILVMGHGGTEHNRAVREAAEQFLSQHSEYADRRVAVFRFWQDSDLSQEAWAAGDFHAGYYETSLMLYWAPDDVRWEAIALDEPSLVALLRQDPDNYQERVQPVAHPDVVPLIRQRREITVGVMGEPSRASREFGERAARAAVAKLVELIRLLEGCQT